MSTPKTHQPAADAPLTDPALAEAVRRLVSAYQPERIYLFGSKARGDAGPDSDYDLLVVVPESREPPYRRAQHAQEVLWGLWTAVDVLVFTREEFESRRAVRISLPAMVLAEGTLLYAARPCRGGASLVPQGPGRPPCRRP